MEHKNSPRSTTRQKPEHTRPMSCRGSDLQQEISKAVRQAAPEKQRAGVRQDYRTSAVIAGSQPACPTLEAVIDDRIRMGASEESILEIAHVIVRQTRRKLMEARPAYAALVRDLDLAIVAETQAQGPADVAAVVTLRQRCANTLRDFVNRMTQHRDAADLVIVAAEAELAEREKQHATTRQHFNLTPRGRAS